MAAKMSKRYQTQWAAQFLAAGELIRRGYLVAIPNGNANFADLLAKSPNGHHFSIDVKGMSGKNWWFIKRPESDNDQNNQYFILVYILPNLAPQYFIFSLAEMIDEINQAEKESRKREIERGKPYAKMGINGIAFEQAFRHSNRWQTLPE